MRLRECIGHATFIASFACAEPNEPEMRPRSCLDYDEIVSDVPDVPVAYTTEHLDIRVSDDRFVCAGSAIEYERHVQYVAAKLDIEIQRRIPVYAMRKVGDYCPPGAIGCSTRDGVVFSISSNIYHELTHGVTCEVTFGAPRILAEGWATSFEPTENDQFSTPEAFADIDSDFNHYYDYSGHFVRWLAGELGADRFRELYGAASNADGVWPDLVAAYGATLADDYAVQAPFMWVPHRQCADVPLLEPEADGGWLFEARLDCDDPSTLGPYEERGRTDYNEGDMYQSFLIEIPEPGRYRFQRDVDLIFGVYYQRCLDEHPRTEQEMADQWVDRLIFFTLFGGDAVIEFAHAGLWRFDVTYPHGPPIDVRLTIEREP